MAHEVDESPQRLYRNFHTSGQRRDKIVPKCTEQFPDENNGFVYCKGPIMQARCMKCGCWYGAGRDPLIGQQKTEVGLNKTI